MRNWKAGSARKRKRYASCARTSRTLTTMSSRTRIGAEGLYEANKSAAAWTSPGWENPLLVGGKSLRPLLAVALRGVADDRIGLRRRTNLVHLDGFALKLFVVLKEAAQHQQAVLW